MDASKEQPKITAGLDLGDKYSYLCLIDADSGETFEEGRLRTTPEAIRRRFASERPLRMAIEAGTPLPWVSSLLEECGHEVLVVDPRRTPRWREGMPLRTGERPNQAGSHSEGRAKSARGQRFVDCHDVDAGLSGPQPRSDWLKRKKLPGSYLAFTRCRRSRLVP
jgi:hypothetical protein